METRLVQCRTCGAEIDFMTGQCPFCQAEAPQSLAASETAVTQTAAPEAPPKTATHVPAPQPATTATQHQADPAALTEPTANVSEESGAPQAASSPASAQDAATVEPPWSRTKTSAAHSPLTFEAEEALLRGDADRALVLASRALKEAPDSLTARSLLERARKGVLRGRRGERLEARIREAQQIADQGDDLAAERIVTSALKLIPNHAKALALFSELRNRRLAPQTAEAEAERELTGLARQRAATGLAQARTAFANGQARRAMMLTRRALRLAPDHAELLALYTEIERQLARTLSVGMLDVRRALTLVNEGRLDEGLELLRALLRDNPDHADAQAAVQEVRRLYARQTSLSLPAAPAPPAPVIAAPRPQSEDHTSPTRDARPALRAPARPAATPVLRERPTTVPATPPTPVRAPRAPLATAAPESPPARVVRIPPSLLIAFIGLVVLAIGASFWWRSRPASLPAPSLPPAAAPTTAPAGAPGVNALASLDPDLRHTIETTLAQYARTLETVNASLLAEVRPDLDSAAREQLLATFEGSINVAVDIRVIEVTSEANATEIMIQRTAVLVGQQNNPLPVIERLRFVRQAEGWALVRAK